MMKIINQKFVFKHSSFRVFIIYVLYQNENDDALSQIG